MPPRESLEQVEERADVVVVDVLQHLFVDAERLVVAPAVLQVHAAVVGHEPEMAPQFQPLALERILDLAQLVAPPAFGGLEDGQQFVDISVDLVARAGSGPFAAEEQTFGHGLQARRVPQIGRPENGHLAGDLAIGHEPILHERQHAERERHRQFRVLLAPRFLALTSSDSSFK